MINDELFFTEQKYYEFHQKITTNVLVFPTGLCSLVPYYYETSWYSAFHGLVAGVRTSSIGD